MIFSAAARSAGDIAGRSESGPPNSDFGAPASGDFEEVREAFGGDAVFFFMDSSVDRSGSAAAFLGCTGRADFGKCDSPALWKSSNNRTAALERFARESTRTSSLDGTIPDCTNPARKLPVQPVAPLTPKHDKVRI